MKLYYEKEKVDQDPPPLKHFQNILKVESPRHTNPFGFCANSYPEMPMMGSSSNLITISMAPTTFNQSCIAEQIEYINKSDKKKKKYKKEKKRHNNNLNPIGNNFSESSLEDEVIDSDNEQLLKN